MCHARRLIFTDMRLTSCPIAFVWNMHCCRKGCPCESAGLSDGENPPRPEGCIGTTSKTLKMKGRAFGHQRGNAPVCGTITRPGCISGGSCGDVVRSDSRIPAIEG